MTCRLNPGFFKDIQLPKISDNPPTYISLVALDVSALSYKEEGAPIKIDLTDHLNKGVSAQILVPNLDGVLDLLKETYGHRYALLLVHESVNIEEALNNLK